MARVMLFIHQHNGVEYAQAKARFFIEEAKAELAAIPQSPARASLMDLADYVLTREH
jgi:geranylgeranyl pyrophosphate synthase